MMNYLMTKVLIRIKALMISIGTGHKNPKNSLRSCWPKGAHNTISIVFITEILCLIFFKIKLS